jgi:glycerol-1-phosphatase
MVREKVYLNTMSNTETSSIQSHEYKMYKDYFGRMNFSPAPETRIPRTVTMELLAKYYDIFFFDGYGTLYIENTPWDDAVTCLEYLRAQNKTIRLLTNAATWQPSLIHEQMAAKGLHFHPSEIITAGSLLEDINQKLQIKEALYIGQPSGTFYLEQAGIEQVQNPKEPFVIFSSVHGITPELWQKAVQILSAPNSLLIVLNPDISAPTNHTKPGERKLVHGYKASQLATQTGCKVIYAGKPFPLLFHKAIFSLFPKKGSICMIGDTMGTDIAGTAMQQLDSALLLRGNTHVDEVREAEYNLGVKPTYYLENLSIMAGQ